MRCNDGKIAWLEQLRRLIMKESKFCSAKLQMKCLRAVRMIRRAFSYFKVV